MIYHFLPLAISRHLTVVCVTSGAPLLVLGSSGLMCVSGALLVGAGLCHWWIRRHEEQALTQDERLRVAHEANIRRRHYLESDF